MARIAGQTYPTAASRGQVQFVPRQMRFVPKSFTSWASRRYHGPVSQWRIVVEFQTDGTAALVTVPFPPIRQDSSSLRSLWADGSVNAADLGDLVSRLEEVVRWLRVRDGERGRGQVLRFGAVEVEPATQTIRRSGQRVAVTRTEFRLLYALMRRPGQVVSRGDLLGEVWGDGVRLRSRAIDTHIARLRRKLEEDPTAPRHIRTAPYRGYCFDPHGG